MFFGSVYFSLFKLLAFIDVFCDVVCERPGVALAETGHALQRGGLRLQDACGEAVKFVTVGSRWAVPLVCNAAQVASDATVLGAVLVEDDTAVGARSVLRGDVYSVVVNQFATIGDDCVVSAVEKQASEGLPEVCVIKSGASIGSGSVINTSVISEDATVGENCVVLHSWVQHGATLEPGTVVLPGSRVPAGETWGGNPVQRIA